LLIRVVSPASFGGRERFAERVEVARRFGTVVLEDLKIANMTASVRGRVGKADCKARQKAGLNRRILAQGRNRFANKLSSKMRSVAVGW
jgi:transposase